MRRRDLLLQVSCSCVAQHCFFPWDVTGPTHSSSWTQRALFLTLTEPASPCASDTSTNQHAHLRSGSWAHEPLLQTQGHQHSQVAPLPWRSEFLLHRALQAPQWSQVAMFDVADHVLLPETLTGTPLSPGFPCTYWMFLLRLSELLRLGHPTYSLPSPGDQVHSRADVVEMRERSNLIHCCGRVQWYLFEGSGNSTSEFSYGYTPRRVQK